MHNIPTLLQPISRQVQEARKNASCLAELQPAWDAHLARVKARIPDVRIEAGGEIISLGELSPGCQACKGGTWDCVFVTNRCNLKCAFCFRPRSISLDYCGSAFGKDVGEIACNYRQTRLTGISFSGGEPFARPEVLFDWIEALASQFPGAYTWVYTNGLLLTEEYIHRLSQLGIQEIRFNAAASGYDHPRMMKIMAEAARVLPNVTVEIPSIPADASRLFKSLAKWSATGVKYLNLHELMYEPGTNSAHMAGARQPVVTPDGHFTEIDPGSRLLTIDVMAQVQREGLPLAVNDCSLQSKLRQLRGRRRCLAPLTRAPHEKQAGPEAFETIFVYRAEADMLYCHPDSLAEMRRSNPQARFFRLVRRAPLALEDPGQWIELEEI